MRTVTKARGSERNEPAGAANGPVRRDGTGITLQVHVQPGAKVTAWAGLHGSALRLRVAARALEGQANAACIAFLADAAGVSRSSIALLRGERSRDKVFRIEGAAPARIRSLLEACGL